MLTLIGLRVRPLVLRLTCLLPLVAASISLSSCSGNGDPQKGGIFWSEEAAKDRLKYKRQALESLEDETMRIHRQNETIRRSTTEIDR